MQKKIEAKQIPITKVVLYKEGIGFFERCGKVTGPTTIDLPCPRTAIEDMLKSLLILNLGPGKTGAVTYKLSESTNEQYKENKFNIRHFSGMADLITLLSGASVKVSMSEYSITGRVIGLAEKTKITNDIIIKEKQLVLFTNEAAFERIDLSDIASIQLEDIALTREIEHQLELIRQNSAEPDRLTIAINDTASREVFIAYKIPTPIWKGSYRLVFVPDGSMLLQSMAIVCNVQDEDWQNVKMILVNTAPLVFNQASKIESNQPFEYRVDQPVTIPQNSSALIPLLQCTVDGERTLLFNADINPEFPYAAIKLKNTTGLILDAGTVAVFEEHAYAGEAKLDILGPEDTCLLPYTLSHNCQITISSEISQLPVRQVRAECGIIYMDYKEQYKSIYQLRNLTDKKQLVYVEHLIRSDRKLSEGQKPLESTPSYHRFKVEIECAQTVHLEIIEEGNTSYLLPIDNGKEVGSSLPNCLR